MGRAVPDAPPRVARRARHRALPGVSRRRRRLRRRVGPRAPARGRRARPLVRGRASAEGRGREARRAREGARPGGTVGAPSRARARHDHVRRVAAHRGRRRDCAGEPPLVPRRRLPDEARVLVLAPPGSLGDRGRRRDVRALRAGAVPRIPRGRRLAADSAAHGGGARRARRARFARAGDQVVGRRRGGGRRGHTGHRACRCRRRRAESRRGDSLRAGAAGVANAPSAGELTGQRDEGARRVSRAVLACRRALG